MLAEYTVTVTEAALLKRVTDHWRRTREPVNARILAELAGWDPRQVRAVLARMEAKQLVQRMGQRGGWLPAQGEAGQGMAERKTKQSNRARGQRRRKDIFEFICAYADEMDGPTPSVNEIAHHFSLNYKTAYMHVLRLIAEGRLRQEKGKLIVVGSEWIEPPRPKQLEFEF